MLSSVDIQPTSVSVTTGRFISNGVTVSRLTSGNFAVAVHEGDRRAIVDLTPGELSGLLEHITRLISSASHEGGGACS